MKAILALVAAVVVLAAGVPDAGAKPCKQARYVDPCASAAKCNPDGRTSITVTGSFQDRDGDTENTNLGVALVYPWNRDMSFLARYDHAKDGWDGDEGHRWAAPNNSSDNDTWTFGLRFYLGR